MNNINSLKKRGTYIIELQEEEYNETLKILRKTNNNILAMVMEQNSEFKNED